MRLHKLTVAIATVVSTSGLAVAADDDVPITANIGVVSNYMWRGLTQTQDGPAVQGGIDYAHDSGFSAGTWVSNVDSGSDDNLDLPRYEWDLYAGYAGKVEDFGYNFTTSYYAYPDGKDLNFWELGASASYEPFTIGLAYTLDGQAPSDSAYREGDLYYYASASMELFKDIKLSGTIGHTDFADLGSDYDYNNWQLAVSKDAQTFGTFSFYYDQHDSDSLADNDPKLSIGWKKTF